MSGGGVGDLYRRAWTGAFTSGICTGRGQGQVIVWREHFLWTDIQTHTTENITYDTALAYGKQWLLNAQKKLSASQFHNPIS